MIVTVGLIIERPGWTEEFTSKSNFRATTEFCVMVMGNGAPDTVTMDGLKVA